MVLWNILKIKSHLHTIIWCSSPREMMFVQIFLSLFVGLPIVSRSVVKILKPLLLYTEYQRYQWWGNYPKTRWISPYGVSFSWMQNKSSTQQYDGYKFIHISDSYNISLLLRQYYPFDISWIRFNLKNSTAFTFNISNSFNFQHPIREACLPSLWSCLSSRYRE